MISGSLSGAGGLPVSSLIAQVLRPSMNVDRRRLMTRRTGGPISDGTARCMSPHLVTRMAPRPAELGQQLVTVPVALVALAVQPETFEDSLKPSDTRSDRLLV